MTMTPELRAEVDAAMAKADKHGWAVDEDGDLVLRVPTCWKEGAWQDKAGRDNAAAIVALHNAYPLLTATIDAQAERIAELEAENARLREALAKTAQPHFWWDVDDSENGCDDITSILDNYEIGEVIEVSCARNLPNQWAVGYVTESGGFRGQTFATEAEAVEFAAARAALTANHSAPVVEE